MIKRIITIYKKIKRRRDSQTRMTTFIKTKFNKSDDHTNIDTIELLLILNCYNINNIPIEKTTFETIAKCCVDAECTLCG